jgi:uncharacterized protein YigE (DUF2233 family)
VEIGHESGRLLKRVVFREKPYYCYTVNLKKNLCRLYLYNNGGEVHDFVSIRTELKDERKDLLFAMNAGMFMPDGSPQGLYIEENGMIKKIDLSKGTPTNFYMQPNGVFGITVGDSAFIVPSGEVERIKTERIRYATQSGPMLLSKGQINSNFREFSSNLNIRNGVGIIDNNTIVLIISEVPVNFFEFAQLFQDIFKCQNALYLDGFVSTVYADDPLFPGLKKTSASGRGLGPKLAIIQK